MFSIIAEQAMWLSVILTPLKIWASWEAAKRDQLGWFVCFFLIGLLGIPEAVYLVWFRKDRHYRW
jgi:hypothetical protein